eukprot:EG_transcript_4029
MADPPLAALLASSSADGVKVWEVPAGGVGGRQTAAIRPGVACKSVRWNASNQMLAVASSAGRVLLSTPQGQTLQAIECGAKEINCVAVSSKYLAAGLGNTVMIHSVKDNSLLHSLSKHTDAITALAFNMDESHLLSGSANGELLLHNTQHGVMVASLASGSHGGICAIQYSIWKRDHAGTVYQDGTFICWDIVGRRPVVSFQQHTGPATGVAFSTVHGALVVTVGVDRRVAFYDVNTKSALKVVMLDQPLAAVSFMEDGSTIAVGSATGAILFLDLKKSDNDATIVTGRLDRAHVGPVHCLQFQLPLSAKPHRRSPSSRSDARSDSGASTPDSMTSSSFPRSHSSTSAPMAGIPGPTASTTSALASTVTTGRSFSGLSASQRSSSYHTSTTQLRDAAFSSATHATPRQSSATALDHMDLDAAPTGRLSNGIAPLTTVPTTTALTKSLLSPIRGQPPPNGQQQPREEAVAPPAPRPGWAASLPAVQPTAAAAVPSAAYGGRSLTLSETSTTVGPSTSTSSTVTRSYTLSTSSTNEKSPNATPRATPPPVPEPQPATPATPAPTATHGTAYGAPVAATAFLQPLVNAAPGTPRSTSMGIPGSSVLSVAGEDAASQAGTALETASRYGPSRVEHAACYGSSPRHVPATSAGPSAPAPSINHDILAGLVDDAMVKLYSATHRDIQGMHVDMIKQFALMQEFVQAQVRESVTPLTQRITELEDQVELLTRRLQGM